MEPTEQNRRAWDEIHRRPTEAIADGLGLRPQARDYLREVNGKHVLQLRCASGEVTADLTALGALVTAVDDSSEALEVARERAPTGAFVQADVHDLPIQLRRGRFDFVYGGEGATPWLDDLAEWAHGIETALRPGGRVVLHDGHPVAGCVDALLHWREDYFGGTTATLGQIVTALVDAGLVLRRLEEFPGERAQRGRDRSVPGLFLLVAEKPA